jgi:hypothetical protein
MRHETGHVDRRNEIKKIGKVLDSGKYDTADMRRFDLLMKRETSFCPDYNNRPLKIAYFSVVCLDDQWNFTESVFDTIEQITDYFAGNKTDEEMDRARIFDMVAEMSPDDSERDIDLMCSVTTNYRDVDDYDDEDLELPFRLEVHYAKEGKNYYGSSTNEYLGL